MTKKDKKLTLDADGDLCRLARADAVVGLAVVPARLGPAHPLQPQLGGPRHNLARPVPVPEHVGSRISVDKAADPHAGPLLQAAQATARAHRYSRQICIQVML
jgi:hypothetical protein